MLTVKQVEQVALRLRKYGLSLDDATALAEIMAGATNGPVQVLAADIASLMRPKRPREIPLSQRPEVVLRRQALRERLSDYWPSEGFEFRTTAFAISHDTADYDALKSAVQYRAKRDGLTFEIRRNGDQSSVVTLSQ